MVSVAGASGPRVRPAVPLKAEPFDLSAVRLLDGPFKHAMDLDIRYLKSLPPDRLLHSFRINAGLPSTAKPLGGWEEPNSEVRGHFVGHYLSACAMAVRATGDAQLKANADRVVAGMAECQARFPSGYLSAFPESFFDRLEALQPVWVPWYTLHKVYQGLLDMYVLTGNEQAMTVLKKAAQWALDRTGRLSDEQMQKVLNTEHGGINEVFANLYAVTGDRRYLKLSQRMNHMAVLGPLMRGEDRLTGLHANTQFPKVIGISRQYELTGDKALRAGAEFFWNVVTRERSYVIGGNSDGEVFSPKEELSKHIGQQSTETCNTYNMLRLTRHIFSWNADGEQADYYERALYNHILASQHPHTGMMNYYVPLKTGSSKAAKTPFGFSEPFDSFWCCTGTGVENHVKYGDSIYWHEGSQGLFVNLFIASELDWKERGVRVRQETRFPDEPRTRVTMSCVRPLRLALHIRRPAWAGNGYRVRVNGQAVRSRVPSVHPGYFTVERTWRTGDVVEVELPMSLWTQAFRDNPNKLAVLYGPLVLCAETTYGNEVACMVGSPEQALAALKPVEGATLEFRGPARTFRLGFGDAGGDVTFRAFFREYERPYVVYWDVLDEASWNARKQEHEQELAAQAALDKRTVDMVRIGDEASEREHGLEGERTGSGPYGSRMWRHATDGGWFSYRLKVRAGEPQMLLITLWGSDAGARTFDVIVDGRKLDTITLANNAPGRFFDRTLELPADLLQGKEAITVRFQGHAGNFAGGVFGLRVVRPE
jgi:DUF1680 family protein